MPFIFEVLLKDERNQVFLAGNQGSPYSMYLTLPEAGTEFLHAVSDEVKVAYRIVSVNPSPRFAQGGATYIAVVEKLEAPVDSRMDETP